MKPSWHEKYASPEYSNTDDHSEALGLANELTLKLDTSRPRVLLMAAVILLERFVVTYGTPGREEELVASINAQVLRMAANDRKREAH